MTDVQAGESGNAEAASGAVASQERDYEAEARKDGWKPKDEYQGDANKWRDARAYVEYGELRDSIRKEMSADYEDRFARLEKVSKRAIDAIKRDADAKIADLKAGRSEAIKKGDEKLVEKFDDAIEKVKETSKEDVAEAEEDAEALEADFMSRNPWYGDDPILTAAAETISKAVNRTYNAKHKKPMPFAENLKEVEAKIKKTPEYRARFGDGGSAANGHAAVDGGSDSPGMPAKRNKTFSDLPSEAKRAYDGFDPKIKAALSKEQYAKEYYADE